MNSKYVTLYLPPEQGAYAEGCLNGQNFRVKTGEFVDVPPYIAEILTGAGKARVVSARSSAAYCVPGGKNVGLLS